MWVKAMAPYHLLKYLETFKQCDNRQYYFREAFSINSLLMLFPKGLQICWGNDYDLRLFDSVQSITKAFVSNNLLSLQPFSQDYDQTSHITYVMWFNFLHEWRNLQSTPIDRFLKNFSWLFHLLSRPLLQLAVKLGFSLR